MSVVLRVHRPGRVVAALRPPIERLSAALGVAVREDTTVAVPVRIANSGPMVMKDQPDTLATLIAALAAKGFAAKK